MSWTSLADRFDSLPLILAGPILRRTEPQAVTVWLALKQARSVTLRVYEQGADGSRTERLVGTRATVRLGDHLHIVAVTAQGDAPLASGETYSYNVYFQDVAVDTPASESTPSLLSSGVIVADLAKASAQQRLVYGANELPTFVLPPQTLDEVRIFHGSCRKPHGVGKDALATLDLVLEESVTTSAKRPQQLYLTGDQIYADDVAAPLLFMLMDAGSYLFGGDPAEELPLVDQASLAPGQRTQAAHELAKLTTETPENQLFTRAEFLAMYLFAWSDVLWPAELPSLADAQGIHPDAQAAQEKKQNQEHERQLWQQQVEELTDFREKLPLVRRALANIPTYMVCDDHDITDDWYLDGEWCANVLGNPLGRRIVRNGLYAYALCQAWGSDPEQFAGPNGASFLGVVDRWHGDERDADAELITKHLGVPDGFEGSGSLPRAECTLHWHFTVDTPCYRVIVLDSRTRRVYQEPKAAPGILSDEAMAEQVVGAGHEVTLVVAQTPILGVDIVEKFQLLSLDRYGYDRESWSLNRHTYRQMLKTLAALGRVVVLSGDVHYGFGSSMEEWDCASPGSNAKIVNFTSSALKNSASGAQKALLTTVYPRLFDILSRGKLPPIDMFTWDNAVDNVTALDEALTAIKHRALLVWWSVPRLMAVLRAPSALVLPAHGWPEGTFDTCPPDRILRLRYLRDISQAAHETAPDRHDEDEPANDAPDPEIHELAAAFSGDGLMSAKAALEATRALRSHAHPTSVRLGIAEQVLAFAHQHFGGSRVFERALEKALGPLLHEAVHDPEVWADQWSDDEGRLHIVGDANIGEIRFSWARKEVSQALWWYQPPSSERPTPATVYHTSLEPPADEDAPPLP